jgi:hypothetical protein
MEKARFEYITLNAKVSLLERQEKEVPEELADALDKANRTLLDATLAHRVAVLEHPKVKAMAEELAKAEARGEELRVEYEALQKQQQPDRQ